MVKKARQGNDGGGGKSQRRGGSGVQGRRRSGDAMEVRRSRRRSGHGVPVLFGTESEDGNSRDAADLVGDGTERIGQEMVNDNDEDRNMGNGGGAGTRNGGRGRGARGRGRGARR